MELAVLLLLACVASCFASVYAITRVRGLIMELKDLNSMLTAFGANQQSSDSGNAPADAPAVDPEQLAAAEQLLSSLGLSIEKDEG